MESPTFEYIENSISKFNYILNKSISVTLSFALFKQKKIFNREPIIFLLYIKEICKSFDLSICTRFLFAF